MLTKHFVASKHHFDSDLGCDTISMPDLVLGQLLSYGVQRVRHLFILPLTSIPDAKARIRFEDARY